MMRLAALVAANCIFVGLGAIPVSIAQFAAVIKPSSGSAARG